MLFLIRDELIIPIEILDFFDDLNLISSIE